TPDRRFLRYVLELALDEARRSHKDYMSMPHMFIALTKLDGGCTQDALRRMGQSPGHVGDLFRVAIGTTGKVGPDTPILPTHRSKEVLQIAERNAIEAGLTFIDERSIVQALLSEHSVLHELLTRWGIDPAHLIEQALASDAHALLERASSGDLSSEAGSV